MTEPDNFILFKNILLDDIKSLSGPSNYNMKKLESRMEQSLYAFFMHTEGMQQERLSFCQYIPL